MTETQQKAYLKEAKSLLRSLRVEDDNASAATFFSDDRDSVVAVAGKNGGPQVSAICSKGMNQLSKKGGRLDNEGGYDSEENSYHEKLFSDDESIAGYIIQRETSENITITSENITIPAARHSSPSRHTSQPFQKRKNRIGENSVSSSKRKKTADGSERPDIEASGQFQLKFQNILPRLLQLRLLCNGTILPVNEEAFVREVPSTNNSSGNIVNKDSTDSNGNRCGNSSSADNISGGGGLQVSINWSLRASELKRFSGKLLALERILQEIKRSSPSEKVVVVSNFMSTLDAIRILAKSNHWSHLRLDGSVPADKRQRLVDLFNGGDRKMQSQSAPSFFLMLLSG